VILAEKPTTAAMARARVLTRILRCIYVWMV
jgi:hypothetical protein